MVMAHGMKAKPGDGGSPTGGGKTGIGSRRIFPPQFKLQVLDSYRHDPDCKGNQRATARKYNIHRRQIQKWLQAESNLRNSVVTAANNNNNCVLVNKNAAASVKDDLHACMALEPQQPLRQRDDSVPAAATMRVSIQALSPVRPVLSPAMATRTPSDRPRCPASPADIASPSRAQAQHAHMPMDLSVRRPSSATAPATPSLPAPWPVAITSASSGRDSLSRSPSPLSSIRSRSRSRSPLSARTQSVIMTPSSSSQSEIWDLSKENSLRNQHKNSSKVESPSSSADVVTKPLFKPYLLDAEEKTIPSATSTTAVGSTNGSSFRGCGYEYTASTYYTYPYDANVDVGYVFDESGVLQPTYLRQLPFTTLTHSPQQHPHPHHPHQQRQSYPLDFKLRAIDSYYRDDVCKGNQRAVAFKYNVHRRQVQKWLKQEDDLRERVDSRHLQT